MWSISDPWRTAAAYVDALSTKFAPASAWQAHRDWRLAALLRHAAQASPLYRSILSDYGGGDARLQDVPSIPKSTLMAHFDQWVTDPEVTLAGVRAFTRDPARIGAPFLGRYTVWESSGSSGEPALFVQDAPALASGDALEAARGPVSLAGPLAYVPGWSETLRMAFVGAIDGHFASIVSLRRGCRLNPWLDANLRTFSFLQPIGELVAQLEAWRPTVLATYPSMAWVLAEEQAAGRLRLPLHAVWTGGETLTPAQRTRIGEVFRVPVRDSYGASECLTIASECRSGHMHLNADWVILESVDEQLRPVPEGEVGATTLLTHLANHVQPIIRYDLGDRVRYTGAACSCGSALPVIEVQGRQDDVLSLHAADGRLVHLAPLALTTVLEEEGGVFDFELRQQGDHVLHLTLHGRCSSAHGLQHACGALRGWLRTQGLAGVRVDGHCAEAPAARGRSGKQRRVRRGGRIVRDDRGRGVQAD
jgi:hypothetical protein